MLRQQSSVTRLGGLPESIPTLPSANWLRGRIVRRHGSQVDSVLRREVRSLTLSVRGRQRMQRYLCLLSCLLTPGRQYQDKAREMSKALQAFRPEGNSLIKSPGELRSILNRLSASFLVKGKEGQTRAREVSRLVWAWSTVCALRPGQKSCPHTNGDFLSVVLLGLRWMTLESADLIKQFKATTTLLVQQGVKDLSPAAVSRFDTMQSLDRLVSPVMGRDRHHTRRILFRVRQEPGFAVGLYQAKRAAAPLRPSFRRGKLDENWDLLTSVQPSDPILLPILKEQVVRTVQELRAFRPSWQLQTTKTAALPSTSASWESSRKEGGSLGFWARSFASEYPGDQIETERKSIPCRRVGIPEPFKLRVISAGKADAYARLLRFQPSLWGLLKDHPQFQLVGRPLRRGDITRFWNNAHRLFGDRAVALSGDYSAATDNLHPSLSITAIDAIIEGHPISESDRNLLHLGLTGHLIDPEDPEMEANQRWGQLMGSPISFPILCIINMAVCRYAVEQQSDSTLSIREAGVLVNGDDCLIPLPSPRGYGEWARLVEACGLKPSPGKCFVSRHAAQLNSMLYLSSAAPQFTPFLRVNLLWGLETKGLLAGTTVFGGCKQLSELSGRSVGLLDGFPRHQRMWLRRAFREVAMPDLERSRPIPLHLSQSWGGLGIPFLRKKDRRWRIGPNQLRVVQRFIRDPSFWLDARRRLTVAADRHWDLSVEVMRSQSAWERSATRREDVLVRKGTEETPSAPVPYTLAHLARVVAKSTLPSKGLTATPLSRVRKEWSRLLASCSSDPLPSCTRELADLSRVARDGNGMEPVRRLEFAWNRSTSARSSALCPDSNLDWLRMKNQWDLRDPLVNHPLNPPKDPPLPPLTRKELDAKVASLLSRLNC
ncbi:RNA-dependent RNA polymerase [Kummerowia striata ourmiavirus]|nr:RNA-dependent RNA polymerase [Kummerowia striata ourmiavirus]